MKKETKASGENIPEARRHTVAVKLRLAPDVADALDGLAESWGLTLSSTVARLVERNRERVADAKAARGWPKKGDPR